MIFPHFDLVLASGSPRRKELMRQLHPDFEIVVPEVDEAPLPEEDPWETARRLAWDKATIGFQHRSDGIAVGADTVVALPAFPDSGRDGYEQLAKPADEADAVRMLEKLSGRRHAVITAVAIRWPFGSQEFDCTSWVAFRELSRSEIEAYAATGEPMDKAGAYAIQSGAKGFVEEYEGSLNCIIGLPVEMIELELLSLGIADQG